jgi:hypothetical protein
MCKITTAVVTHSPVPHLGALRVEIVLIGLRLQLMSRVPLRLIASARSAALLFTTASCRYGPKDSLPCPCWHHMDGSTEEIVFQWQKKTRIFSVGRAVRATLRRPWLACPVRTSVCGRSDGSMRQLVALKNFRPHPRPARRVKSSRGVTLTRLPDCLATSVKQSDTRSAPIFHVLP